MQRQVVPRIGTQRTLVLRNVCSAYEACVCHAYLPVYVPISLSPHHPISSMHTRPQADTLALLPTLPNPPYLPTLPTTPALTQNEPTPAGLAAAKGKSVSVCTLYYAQ